MTFPDLVKDLKRMPFDEKRKEDEGYFEFVISYHHLGSLLPALERYFGVPFKPPGVKPTREMDLKTEDFGGIQKHQTLYYKEAGVISSCALIWPWNDGSRATVKVAEGNIQKK